MISCALLCDAAIGNVQEKTMKNYNAPNSEIIFYSYFIGFFYLLFALLVDGDLTKGYSFCYQVEDLLYETIFVDDKVATVL
jgi:adenosine 3'-phospho 5'-phosphosulfate transporter B3